MFNLKLCAGRRAMTAVVLLLTVALWSAGCARGQELAPVLTSEHGANSAETLKKHYVILVSLDGFRYDYAQKYHAENLLALAKAGATAPEGMIPR